MNYNIEGTLSSAVADAGTFTASYPTNTDEGSFQSGVEHQLMIGQNSALTAPADFSLSFGTTDITVTNKSGASWPSGSSFILGLQAPGRRLYRDDLSAFEPEATVLGRTLLCNLGAPDTADVNGFVESQDLTAAGVFSVDTTAAAAIAAAALAGTADVPRNVVAAWTGTGVLTITGTDRYGNAMVESSASGTSLNGKKAFKTVTGISSSANITSLTVGTGKKIGLPVFLPSTGHVVAVMQDGVRLAPSVVLEKEIDQTRLLAGTSVYTVTPKAGIVERMTSVVTTAVTTGGDITLEIETVAVSGLTVVVADAAAVGDIDTDVPTTLDGSSTTNYVAALGDLEIIPASAFATAGALSVQIEINTQGIFTAGDQTSGGATATTGDVLGTYVPPVAPDGAAVFQVLLALPDAGYAGTENFAG